MELQSPESRCPCLVVALPRRHVRPRSRPAVGLAAPTSPGSTRRSGGRSSSASPRRRRPAHRPLLVIAGAGSGKTLTLAARVARLVLAGADPARILLLTFSRRAAARDGAARRPGPARGARPARRRGGAPRLAWCGTFHSVGARLLRAHAAALGLDPSFTVDDRGDSEDLIHVLRAAARPGRPRRRFPQKATCLAIYSRVVNARGRPRRGAAPRLSLVRRCARRPRSGCSPPTPPRSRRSTCSTSTTCSLVGGGARPSRRRARRWRRASTTSSSTSTRTPTACRRRSCSACGPTAAA